MKDIIPALSPKELVQVEIFTDASDVLSVADAELVKYLYH